MRQAKQAKSAIENKARPIDEVVLADGRLLVSH
jgi:hypothetical protein